MFLSAFLPVVVCICCLNDLLVASHLILSFPKQQFVLSNFLIGDHEQEERNHLGKIQDSIDFGLQMAFVVPIFNEGFAVSTFSEGLSQASRFLILQVGSKCQYNYKKGQVHITLENKLKNFETFCFLVSIEKWMYFHIFVRISALAFFVFKTLIF